MRARHKKKAFKKLLKKVKEAPHTLTKREKTIFLNCLKKAFKSIEKSLLNVRDEMVKAGELFSKTLTSLVKAFVMEMRNNEQNKFMG